MIRFTYQIILSQFQGHFLPISLSLNSSSSSFSTSSPVAHTNFLNPKYSNIVAIAKSGIPTIYTPLYNSNPHITPIGVVNDKNNAAIVKLFIILFQQNLL